MKVKFYGMEGKSLIKKYEVEQMIKDKFSELDGIIEDKSNEDGTYDLYFVETNDENKDIIVDFITWHNGDKNYQEHNKYRIIVDDIFEEGDINKQIGNSLFLKSDKDIKEIFKQFAHNLRFDESNENWEPSMIRWINDIIMCNHFDGEGHSILEDDDIISDKYWDKLNN